MRTLDGRVSNANSDTGVVSKFFWGCVQTCVRGAPISSGVSTRPIALPNMQDQCGLFLVLVIAFVAGVYASDMRQTLLSPRGGGGVCGRRAAAPAPAPAATPAAASTGSTAVSAQRASATAPSSDGEPEGCSGAAASITKQELVNGLRTAATKTFDMHRLRMEDQTHSKKLGMNGNMMAQMYQLCSGTTPPSKPTSCPPCAMPGHVG